VFDSGILTKGENVAAFVKMITDYTKARHAFLTTSATTALSVCLKLLDVGPGDEVVVADFSFPASANVVEDLGATTVLADVSLQTYNMLPEQLERKITSKTKAVIFVDALGNPSGVEDIAAICKSRGIPLIEDSACAMGSSVGDKKVGSIADLSCFSLHPRKLLTTGEGGIITTNNDDWANSLRVKLNHGADANGDFTTFGYNYRLPELAAVMGCHQLGIIDSVIAERRRQYDLYCELLVPLGFKPQEETGSARTNRQSVVFMVPDGTDRNRLIAALKAREIESTLGTYCLSACSWYRQKYNDIQPNAYFLQEHTITLPCYHGVPVEHVCEVIADV
jgi:dTDP-4-amino-4,6-dideoxygalactose transaminase